TKKSGMGWKATCAAAPVTKTSCAPCGTRPTASRRRPDMSKYVGSPIKRREDPRFIQGRGSYVANLKLPNMAYLAIKRSPYAHARIKAIHTEAAKALPGVIDVFTGADTTDVGPMPSGWNVPGIKVPV